MNDTTYDTILNNVLHPIKEMYISDNDNDQRKNIVKNAQNYNIQKNTCSSRWLTPESCTTSSTLQRPRARSESNSSSRHQRSSSFDLNSRNRKKHNNNNNNSINNQATSNKQNRSSKNSKKLSPLTPVSLLCYTVINRDETLLLKLLSQYANQVNELSEDGLSPLHLASMDGNTEIMGILLDHGAMLNLGDFKNRSSLEYAVLAGQFDAAQFLIENGCDTSLIRDGCSFY